MQRNPQVQRAVDQRPRQPLLLQRHVACDEDVGNVETDVDSDGPADHGREDKGPVPSVLRDEGKEEAGPEVPQAGDEHEDGAGNAVHDEAAYCRDKQASKRHGDGPRDDLQRTGSKKIPKLPYKQTSEKSNGFRYLTANTSAVTSGSPTTQPSTYTNAARSTTPSARHTSIYAVAHCLGACALPAMANTSNTSPGTSSPPPSQSIPTFLVFLRSAKSLGVEKNEVTAVTAARIPPMKKYQRQVRNLPLNPEKKIPTKNPSAAQAPYTLKTRFFRGPGRYTLPRIIMPEGRNAASARPCSARQMTSISQVCEKPARMEEMASQVAPKR
ncbi:hypothetical protein ACP6JB_002644 [Aspergillus fumigatus]